MPASTRSKPVCPGAKRGHISQATHAVACGCVWCAALRDGPRSGGSPLTNNVSTDLSDGSPRGISRHGTATAATCQALTWRRGTQHGARTGRHRASMYRDQKCRVPVARAPPGDHIARTPHSSPAHSLRAARQSWERCRLQRPPTSAPVIDYCQGMMMTPETTGVGQGGKGGKAGGGITWTTAPGP